MHALRAPEVFLPADDTAHEMISIVRCYAPSPFARRPRTQINVRVSVASAAENEKVVLLDGERTGEPAPVAMWTTSPRREPQRPQRGERCNACARARCQRLVP